MKDLDTTEDTLTFHYSGTYKGLILFGIVFFFFMFFLVVAAILFELRLQKMWWMYILVGAYIPLIYLSLVSWRHRKDYVQVDAAVIKQFSRNQQPAVLSFQDVSEIRERALLRKLQLIDAHGHKVIDLDYALENFNRLRGIVYQNTLHLCEKRALHKVFYRAASGYGLYIFGLMLFIAYGVLCLWLPYLPGAFISIAFFLLCMFGLSQQVRKVEVGSESVKLIYFFRQKELPYSQIAGIALENLELGGADRAEAVLIKRHKGKEIKLLLFKEGSLTLFDSLNAAWKVGNQ